MRDHSPAEDAVKNSAGPTDRQLRPASRSSSVPQRGMPEHTLLIINFMENKISHAVVAAKHYPARYAKAWTASNDPARCPHVM